MINKLISYSLQLSMKCQVGVKTLFFIFCFVFRNIAIVFKPTVWWMKPFVIKSSMKQMLTVFYTDFFFYYLKANSVDHKVFKYLNTTVPGYQSTQISECLYTSVPGYHSVWIPAYLDIRIPGYQSVCISECLDIRIYVYQSVWI